MNLKKILFCLFISFIFFSVVTLNDVEANVKYVSERSDCTAVNELACNKEATKVLRCIEYIDNTKNPPETKKKWLFAQDCASTGYLCYDGKCLTSCRDNTHCARPDYYCNNNQCIFYEAQHDHCTTGATRCSTNKKYVQQCIENMGGYWINIIDCKNYACFHPQDGNARCNTKCTSDVHCSYPYICINGKCETCRTGQTRCSSDKTKVLQCNILGKWETLTTCPADKPCQIRPDVSILDKEYARCGPSESGTASGTGSTSAPKTPVCGRTDNTRERSCMDPSDGEDCWSYGKYTTDINEACPGKQLCCLPKTVTTATPENIPKCADGVVTFSGTLCMCGNSKLDNDKKKCCYGRLIDSTKECNPPQCTKNNEKAVEKTCMCGTEKIEPGKFCCLNPNLKGSFVADSAEICKNDHLPTCNHDCTRNNYQTCYCPAYCTISGKLTITANNPQSCGTYATSGNDVS
ncbi:MAG: hypothetical protein QW594_02865, partial [Candidatus Woesearchaeota archaeon]